jgi:hypothetical protein
MLEFENRLRTLLPQWDVCFAPPPFAALPLERGAAPSEGDGQEDGSVELDGSLGGSTPIVANAPQAGERFSRHIDGDPSVLIPSPFADLHGAYPNRTPGRPRLASALVYLNSVWDAEAWGAPTALYDPPTGCQVRVRPSPGRVLLLDQDLTHAVTAPEAAAGERRARYSLVWKLALYPRQPTTPPCSGEPTTPPRSPSCSEEEEEEEMAMAGAVTGLCPRGAAAAAEAAGRTLVVGSAAWAAGRPADWAEGAPPPAPVYVP